VTVSVDDGASNPLARNLDVELCEREEAVARIARRIAEAPRIAVDVEANGLFAYRPALCTIQIAWDEGGASRVAIVDARKARAEALAPVFGASGPVKVLHDLTFDAKLLELAGAPLARVRDTSVAARFLGQKASGLVALLGSELGVAHDKAFQQHDWAERPLTPPQIAYLAADVRHLLALDDKLAERARALDVEAEIEDECAYKLATALRPPKDARPLWVRVRGVATLAAQSQAILRRLILAREAVAEREDVPPFKVIGNDVLLELARRMPSDAAAVRRVRGAGAGRAGRFADVWTRAIADGVADGAPPDDERAALTPERRDRTLVAKTRLAEAKLATWRKREAESRGVDEQVVLPGHCAHDFVAMIIASAEPPSAAAIRALPGFGGRRADRYAEALAKLAEGVS
jgi:ribonuclease D